MVNLDEINKIAAKRYIYENFGMKLSGEDALSSLLRLSDAMSKDFSEYPPESDL